MNSGAAGGNQALQADNSKRMPDMAGWRHASGAMAVALIVATAGAPSADAQSKKAVPYWASISQPEARMRVGPNLDYPSNWIYQIGRAHV